MLRSLAILAVLLGLLAAAGCGKSSADKYKDDFPPLSAKIVGLGTQVGNTISGAGKSSNQQLAAAFGGYARQLGDLREQVDDLDPPSDLKDDQDKLVSAMGQVQRDLGDISSAARQGNPGAARGATARLIQDSVRLRDARRALARAVRAL